MITATAPTATTRRVQRTAELPTHLHHPDFDSPGAARTFDPQPLLDSNADFETKYMPDDVTREHARRMHYAAARAHAARTRAERSRWLAAYIALRDRIVLGNRKLVYRAVRRRSSAPALADDMIGDSQIVLIQAVAAFNPWIPVRFSTYAYTCLVRALARQARRRAADRLANAMSFDSLPDGEPRLDPDTAPHSSGSVRLDEFLRAEHPLLDGREKAVLARRFIPADGSGGQTLEQVGRAVGLSKERVRQVQAAALVKLRRALAPANVH